MNDADDTEETTPEGEGSDDNVQTPEQKGSNPDELVASYRRRQAGAEAARQAAEARATAAEAKVREYEAKHQTAEQAELSETARLQANLEAAERRAEEAEAKATARVLDARFPNARRELPEVTDEVKLARFEAMLADQDPTSVEPPDPMQHNEAKPQAKPAAKKETLEELEARVLATAVPEGW
jgi:hypothetical protein